MSKLSNFEAISHFWSKLMLLLLDGGRQLLSWRYDILSPTIIYRWLAKRFLQNLGLVVLALGSFVYFFQFVEYSRKKISGEATWLIPIKAAFFETFNQVIEYSPFLVVLATIIFFYRLAGRSELIAARVLGFTPWQIILPIMLTAGLLGFLYVFVFTPLQGDFNQQLTAIKNNSYQIENGSLVLDKPAQEFWLKEKIPSNLDNNSALIIHAKGSLANENRLEDAEFYIIGEDGLLKIIIEAKEVFLRDNTWYMTGVTKREIFKPVEQLENYSLPSLIRKKDLKNLLLGPEALSIYNLRSYLTQGKLLDFPAYQYQVYYYQLLALPVMLIAMTLLGAGFSFHYRVRGSRLFLIFSAIVFGFMVHFFIQVIRAFLRSQELPALLVAFMPTIILLLLSLTLFIHKEEG